MTKRHVALTRNGRSSDAGRDLGQERELNLMVIAGREPRHRSLGDWWCTWVETAALYVGATQRAQANEEEIRSELLFCLIGGYGIPYELAKSAWERLVELGCLTHDWDLDELEELLERELGRPQFRPVRRDGSLRRYRYPRSKARLVVAALRWLESGGPVNLRLDELESERERRRLLCECPGIGPKTGSWILRNSGYASELAILDVHVLRAMEQEGRRPAGRLPGAYELVEDEFLRWCYELHVPAAAFDLFLWEWQRGNRAPLHEAPPPSGVPLLTAA